MSDPSLALPSRRALSYASFIYLLVICTLSIPRVMGPSWRALMAPMAMRNLEGFPVQWEAFLVLRSLYSMSTNETPDDLIEWYSTDEYRATLPIYFAAVIAQLTDNYILGLTLSDVIWWWFGAIGVFILARSFSTTHISFYAGLLTCFSPLGVSHIGSATLHTASSLSFSTSIATLWILIHSSHLHILSVKFLYGFCVYVSSITYNYQWVIIPLTLIIAILPNYSWRRLSICIYGTVIFFIVRWSSYELLYLGNLSVHSHQNDPIRVLLFTLAPIFEENTLINVIPSFVSLFVKQMSVVSYMYISSFGQPVVFAAVIGAAFTRRSHEFVIHLSLLFLSYLFGTIYGVPWVIMISYPSMYLLAARGIAHVHRIILTRQPTKRFSFLHRSILVHVIQFSTIAMIGMGTNLDLFDVPDFAVTWWQGWYVPH